MSNHSAQVLTAQFITLLSAIRKATRSSIGPSPFPIHHRAQKLAKRPRIRA